ncbi:DUF4405 domain-containing protein [Methanosarcina sp. Z-7115]|uniref:DUF4405 domain-containing protein n=1 Tax=Methanosarcina baikalica TaxID=3073890 RepID=A0ABU2D291_9EURY|nr:DUF4405 domain-containing protein [Methanosarcina sp. Z-7115]MDR7666056.1 DUF4405 domain-containing protein [Methanosarcina sp. Z-7115]
MNRLKLNYFVDLALFVQFALVGFSGILLLLNGHGVSQLWKGIHEQLGILMLVFFVVHIALHWRWIVFTTKNFFRIEREMKAGEVIEANYMPVD